MRSAGEEEEETVDIVNILINKNGFVLAFCWAGAIRRNKMLC